MSQKNSPDFIGLGVKKSGTTWLYHALNEHPGIEMSEPKEINFFSDSKQWPKGAEWYLSHFNFSGTKKRHGEFSTTYLHNPDTAQRIKKLFPRAKLIVILRNPVERFVSSFYHSKSKGYYKNMSITDVIEKLDTTYKQGLYAEHIKKYYELFPKDQILILWFDDLKNTPEKLLRELYSFLEVEPNFKPSILYKKYNSREVNSSNLYKLINKIYLRLKKYPIGKIVLRTFTILGINSKTIQHILSRKKKMVLSPMNKKSLYKLYENDIYSLENIVSRDISNWKIK